MVLDISGCECLGCWQMVCEKCSNIENVMINLMKLKGVVDDIFFISLVKLIKVV